MPSPEPIIDSIRSIIARHVSGDIPITSNVQTGDDIIELKTTDRLKEDYELTITNNDIMDDVNQIEAIIDKTHIKLKNKVRFNWDSSSSFIKLLFDSNYVKSIFFGEPDVIPSVPAITVDAKSLDSKFLTTRATNEKFQLEIGVFVENDSQESGSRTLQRLVSRIENALKKNIFPLVGNYKTYSITQDIVSNDVFIKVEDSSKFITGSMILIENTFYVEEFIISAICDSTTLKLQSPVTHNFSINDTKIIVPKRFIYNSWPATITYGKIYKGTLLKGASISWFAEEVELQFNTPRFETQTQ